MAIAALAIGGRIEHTVAWWIGDWWAMTRVPVLPQCFHRKVKGLSDFSLSPCLNWWSQPGSNR
jgi:hypothetical protein